MLNTIVKWSIAQRWLDKQDSSPLLPNHYLFLHLLLKDGSVGLYELHRLLLSVEGD